MPFLLAFQRSIWKNCSVQNKAARLFLAEDAPSSSTQCLKLLHWLPIHLRIQHKVLTLVFKAVHGEGPQYLRDMFTHRVTSRNLRSTNRYKELHIPSVKTKTFANRSIDVVGAKWWNALPDSIKKSQNLDNFKSNLKTYLYKFH